MLLVQQHCNTHPAFPTVSVTSILMFWTFCTILISNQKAPLLTPFGSLFITAKKKAYKCDSLWRCTNPFCFSNVRFLLYDTLPILNPLPKPLLLATMFFLLHELLVFRTVCILNDYIFSTSNQNLGRGSLKLNFNDSCGEIGWKWSNAVNFSV